MYVNVNRRSDGMLGVDASMLKAVVASDVVYLACTGRPARNKTADDDRF